MFGAGDLKLFDSLARYKKYESDRSIVGQLVVNNKCLFIKNQENEHFK